MDRRLATKISGLTLDDAADFLAKKAVLAKSATPSLAEFSQLLANPVRHMTGCKTVPHIPMEVLRNALIGMGVGGLGTMASQPLKPEHERRYGSVLDNALLGSVLGAGGTLAYRHLGHSGDPANPARFQESVDKLTTPPATKTEGARKLDEITAAPTLTRSTATPAVAPENTAAGQFAINNEQAPAVIRRIAGHLAKNEPGQAAAAPFVELASKVDLANRPGEAAGRVGGGLLGARLGWGLASKPKAESLMGKGFKGTGKLLGAGVGGTVGAYAPEIYSYLTGAK